MIFLNDITEYLEYYVDVLIDARRFFLRWNMYGFVK